MDAALQAFSKYVEQGGYVMPPLIGAAMVLWYALGYRCALLWRGARTSPRSLMRAFTEAPDRAARGPVELAVKVGLQLRARVPPGDELERALDADLGEIKQRLGQFKTLAKTVVSVAPLLGLLGTVSGMIETFSALGNMALFSQSGGIAGGISQALLTTQFGLSIAIPGLVAGSFLERRQRALEERIDETHAALSGKTRGERTQTS